MDTSGTKYIFIDPVYILLLAADTECVREPFLTFLGPQSRFGDKLLEN